MLSAIVFGPLVLILIMPLPYDHDLSVIMDKLRILKESKGERIVFVGGSGLLFGIDSDLVHERFQREVVNFGLYAGFGLKSLMHAITPNLRAGDVVVISPEYTLVFDHLDRDARKWLYALDPAATIPVYRAAKGGAGLYLSDLNELLRSRLRAMPAAVNEAFQTRSFKPLLSSGRVAYGRYFSPRGDSLRPAHSVSSPELLGHYGVTYFDTNTAQEVQSFDPINQFCRKVSAGRVTVLFVFPAYPEAEYRRQAEGMRRYEKRVRKEVSCLILGSPEDFLYPYSFFTDTVHHLNQEGKRKRTERIIELLLEVRTLTVKQQKQHDAGIAHTS